jgi:hypothetical protein
MLVRDERVVFTCATWPFRAWFAVIVRNMIRNRKPDVATANGDPPQLPTTAVQIAIPLVTAERCAHNVAAQGRIKQSFEFTWFHD